MHVSYPCVGCFTFVDLNIFWCHFHQWQMISWQVIHETKDRKIKIPSWFNDMWRKNQCQIHASQLLNCYVQVHNGNWIERTLKSFKRLEYTYCLPCLSCDATWLSCAKCLERQSYSHMMKTCVNNCIGITIDLRDILNRNISISLLTKCQYNKLMSTSLPDAQSFLNLSENDHHGNAGKKQKEECYLSQWYASSASFLE